MTNAAVGPNPLTGIGQRLVSEEPMVSPSLAVAVDLTTDWRLAGHHFESGNVLFLPGHQLGAAHLPGEDACRLCSSESFSTRFKFRTDARSRCINEKGSRIWVVILQRCLPPITSTGSSLAGLSGLTTDSDLLLRHINAYTNQNFTTWAAAGNTNPKNSLVGC